MRMNPGIILSAEQPDMVNTLARSNVAAAQSMQNTRTNKMNNVLAQHGAGLVSGDKGAINALAALDPAAAMGLQSERLNQQMAQKRMAALDAQERRSLEAHAAKLDAATRAAEARQIEDGIVRGIAAYKAGDLAGVNAVLTAAGEQPIQSLEMFPAVAARYGEALDVLKSVESVTAPDDEYGRYVQETLAVGGEPLGRIEYAQAKKGSGLSITTADGTTITQGGPRQPVGQDLSLTATPRDGGKLADELSKDDADYLAAEREKSRAAESLEGMAQQLQTLAPHVGYTGPGGNLVGAVDDMIGILPGDSGARGAFKSLSTDARLTFTEKTKGAITEAEMALFAMAVPNLSHTPEANEFIAEVLVSGARRVQTRQKFMEQYAGRVGSLEGAEDAWDRYIETNPLLVQTKDGNLDLREEGDWRSYLQGPSPNTPGGEIPDFGSMSIDELREVDIDSLSDDALDAWIAAGERI